MKLFILNDNVNTFDNVINSIQMYLNYPYMQGLSIAHIVNDVGECLVKESDDTELIEEIYEGLVSSGLNVKLEK